MAMPNPDSLAFCRPGGEICPTSKARAVDMLHLSRQTMGDRELEAEVLGLFMQQARTVREQIARATHSERIMLAHALKGSARGVGAFAVADCAARIEATPGDTGEIGQLGRRIDDVREFLASISR
jgi:HPt (histidine-containing phosphotransfer) domain-containing protein